MSTAAELYPLATQDGKSIPLDVVKPLSLFSALIVEGTPTVFEVPADYVIAAIYATVDCIVRFSATPLPSGIVTETAYSNAIFVPANILCNLVVTPGAASVLGVAGAGVIYISSVQQWAALIQPNQANFG